MDNERLKKQIAFIVEIDKAKQVLRRNLLMDGSRNENDAEHSWHLAMAALLLSEHASTKGMDMFHIVKMLLVHDLVEIYAGDTYSYDEKAHEDKYDREQRAADKLFGILPADQAREFRDLWEEFESHETPEGSFAACIDKMMPVIHNYNSKGIVWRENNISSDRVLKRNEPLKDTVPELWDYISEIIADAETKGYLFK